MSLITTPTFDQLPTAFAELQTSFERVENLLLQKETPQPEDEIFDVNEVVSFTGFSKPTIYGYCQKREIPHYKKGGKTFFFKSEIIKWLKEDKQKTLKELNEEADVYLNPKK
ncbi:helix-turn-helix domain-containing protein [Flavobacterium psychrophilum]|uniref:helix-turn-helix domain-containing protein n=1 Tax=Flavobacterium psychrophilum TaxID=96345 RepID=UPI001888CA49|nr:helix-turn-helix domain-containing protein [Flavobacterium psychrophilum]MBF2024615.1 helix-turn-helix domain-containing protein [Flavobacterium psychrophilum]MCB5983428.1 helix-turn-helix domain-containing protein [Flavobacterium psychrophilum]MCB5994246.1 helix-turn-helix domain-containing protein [Flavobacterium psychrophilum]MCB5996547.1 helix-turn-helix domain-containing protein [Flavobacterium psychrophilum]MCB6003972.1 helix-turn-helix domain-containing protein [Flavobacterium psychr